MNLQRRIDLLTRLGEWMKTEELSWIEAKKKATMENGWFIPEFVELATKNVADQFLPKQILENWAKKYQIPEKQQHSKNIGIVMAGNIPLVGFHDLLATFISGHKTMIKPSSKDSVLVKHLVEKLQEWDPRVNDLVQF